MPQNRFKSKILWMSIVSLILLIVNQFADVDSEKIKTVIDGILMLLVTLGVLNNPNNSEKL